MTFFGDGATSEGDFQRRLNYAGVFELPVVFFCQNNQWAISVPRARSRRASRRWPQKALRLRLRGRAGGRQRPARRVRGVRPGRGRGARRRRPDPDRGVDLPHGGAHDLGRPPPLPRGRRGARRWRAHGPAAAPRAATWGTTGCCDEADVQAIREESAWPGVQAAVERAEGALNDRDAWQFDTPMPIPPFRRAARRPSSGPGSYGSRRRAMRSPDAWWRRSPRARRRRWRTTPDGPRARRGRGRARAACSA